MINRLFKEYPDYFEFSVSYTTRAPRDGEKHGVNYFYVSREEFEKHIKTGDFLEHVEFSGNCYGTSKSYIESINKKGKICLLEVDIQGSDRIVAQGYPCNAFFISPPSIDDLHKRLSGRGTETEDQIEKRVRRAEDELKEAAQRTYFDKNFINGDLDVCYNEIKEFLTEKYPMLKF